MKRLVGKGALGFCCMASWPIGIMGWELGRVGKSMNYDIRTYISIVYKTPYCTKVLVLAFLY